MYGTIRCNEVITRPACFGPTTYITYRANEHFCSSYNGFLVGTLRYIYIFFIAHYSVATGSSCYIYYILFHPAIIVKLPRCAFECLKW